MNCVNPRKIYKNLDPKEFPFGLEIPCGQCMNCRIMKREEWAMRCMHELLSHDVGMFVTLTFNEESLCKRENPESISKDELQRFFKRLRKLSGKKLKYFANGEYGEERARPHYHAIIFGLDFASEQDREYVRQAWQYCTWPELERDPKTNPFGSLEPNSIRYVVGYIEKKITGKWEKYAYEGIQKPFHLVSKGLGKKYAQENREDLEKNGFLRNKGHRRSIPRYYSEVANISRDRIKEHARETETTLMEKLTGLENSFDEIRMSGMHQLSESVRRKISAHRIQHNKNLLAKSEVFNRQSSGLGQDGPGPDGLPIIKRDRMAENYGEGSPTPKKNRRKS